MAFDSSDIESRTLGLERKIYQIRQTLDELATFRIAGVEQGLAMLWMVAGQQRCTTIIAGQIIGGLATPTALLNSSLHVTGHVSGVDYGTFPLASGVYSIPLQLDTADTSIDLVTNGPAPRFQAGPPVNVAVTQCASNAIADIKATPAAGYAFESPTGQFQYPIATTLNYDHSVFGTGTIVLDGTGTVWRNTCVQATSAAGACPSVSTKTAFGVSTALTTYSFGYFSGIPPTSCPVSRLCSDPGNTALTLNFGATSISLTPPGETTKFDNTRTILTSTEPLFHGSTTHTLRIFEP